MKIHLEQMVSAGKPVHKNFMLLLASAVISASLALSGCADRGNKETVTSIAGAALGGLLGAQFGGGKGQLVTTGLGVLLGALAGSELGRTLDDVDRLKANKAATTAHTSPIGHGINWNNPETGNRGTVTAVRDGTSQDGLYCREFQQTITVESKTQTGTGVACRRPDGTWRIVE